MGGFLDAAMRPRDPREAPGMEQPQDGRLDTEAPSLYRSSIKLLNYCEPQTLVYKSEKKIPHWLVR